MHPDLEQYLANPRANKIAFIKLLRTLTGSDLKTAKEWADKAFGPNLHEVNAALAGITGGASSIRDLCRTLLLVLEGFYGDCTTVDELQDCVNHSGLSIRGDKLVTRVYNYGGNYYIFARMHRS